MKKLLLLLPFMISSCISDDSSHKHPYAPEKFDIRVEIKGEFSIPRASIFINSTGVENWENIDLPFAGQYVYYLKGNETDNSECKCINISAWAYIGKANKMQVFNLYVDGELVDSKTVTPDPYPDGTIQPTTVEFVYKP